MANNSDYEKMKRNTSYSPTTKKIGRESMELQKAMCQGRWGGDWSEAFARWDKENDARMD